jgi:hypothetical protein
MKILLAQRRIEAVSMASGGNVSRWRTFPEHLLDGISGYEVNEQENEAHDQPDDRQGVEDALEDGFQFSSRLSLTLSS